MSSKSDADDEIDPVEAAIADIRKSISLSGTASEAQENGGSEPPGAAGEEEGNGSEVNESQISRMRRELAALDTTDSVISPVEPRESFSQYNIKAVSKQGVMIAKFEKIHHKLSQAEIQNEVGIPTAMAVSNMHILVGTSKGLVVVIDHSQAIKGVLGSEQMSESYKAVTSVGVTRVGKVCMVGHESGAFVAWNLETFATILAVDGVMQEVVTDVVILADGGSGIVVYVSGSMFLVKIVASKKPSVSRLLDGSASHIYDTRPLIEGSTEFFTDSLQVVAFITRNRMLGVISLHPELQILARINIHGDRQLDEEEQRYLPTISWSSTSGPDIDPASGEKLQHSTLPPTLAVLDNKELQVYSIMRKGGVVRVDRLFRRELQESGQRVEFISERLVLVLQMTREEVRVTAYDIFGGDAVARFTISIDPVNMLCFTDNTGRLVPSYSKGIAAYSARIISRNRLYFISPTASLICIKFKSWDALVDSFIENSNWTDAISLVALSLRGETKYSIALPHSPALKSKLLKDKSAFLLFKMARYFLSELIPAEKYAEEAVQIPWNDLEKKIADTFGQPVEREEGEGNSYIKAAMSVLFEAAAATDNFQLMLSPHFQEIIKGSISRIKERVVHWFYVNVEQHVTRAGASDLVEISEDFYKHLVSYFVEDTTTAPEETKSSRKDDLENIFLSCSVGAIGRGLVVDTCTKYGMYKSLVWHFVTTLSPDKILSELWLLMEKEQAGSARQEELKEILFQYMAYMFDVDASREWRYGDPGWNNVNYNVFAAPEVKLRLFKYMIQPPNHEKKAEDTHEGRSQTFVQFFMDLDAQAAMAVMARIHDDVGVNEEVEQEEKAESEREKKARTPPPPVPMRRREDSSASSIDGDERAVDLNEKMTRVRILEILGRELLENVKGISITELIASDALKDEKLLLYANFVARMYTARAADMRISIRLTNLAIAGLLRKGAKDIDTGADTGADTDGETDGETEDMLLVMLMADSSQRLLEAEKEEILKKAKELNFYSAAEHLLVDLGRYEEVIRYILGSEDDGSGRRKKNVFSYITRHLDTVEGVRREVLALVREGELLYLSESETTAILVEILGIESGNAASQDEYELVFAKWVDRILDILPDDFFQFKFLHHVVQKPKENMAHRVSFPTETVKMYFRLLCEYSPNDVLAFLQSDANYPLDYCLELTKRYEIVDASLELMERTGDIFTLIDVSLVDFSKMLDTLYGEDGDVSQSIEAIRRRIMGTLDVVNRSGPRLDPSEAEEMWFKILDTVIMKQAELKSKSQLSEKLIGNLYDEKLDRLRGVFEDCTQTMIHAMMGVVPVQTIFRKLLSTSSYQGNEFGEFRAYFRILVDTLKFEQRVLESTCRSINVDNFTQALRSYTKRASAIYPAEIKCMICDLPLEDYSPSSVIFDCGHCYHESCLGTKRRCLLCYSEAKAAEVAKANEAQREVLETNRRKSEVDKVMQRYMRRMQRFDKQFDSYENSHMRGKGPSEDLDHTKLTLKPLFDGSVSGEVEDGEFAGMYK